MNKINIMKLEGKDNDDSSSWTKSSKSVSSDKEEKGNKKNFDANIHLVRKESTSRLLVA